MSAPILLASASLAGAPLPQHTVHWTGTQLSGGGMFWLGLVNIAMLVAFLVIATRYGERAKVFTPRGSAGADRPGGRVRGDGDDDRPTSPARSDGDDDRPAATRPVALLASDTERDAAAEQVAHAMAEGRLSVDEGVARLDAVFGSRDRHQLATTVADLPTEPGEVAARPCRCARDLRDFAALALGAAVVLQFLAGIWEMWPVVVAAMAPFVFRPAGLRAQRADRAPGR